MWLYSCFFCVFLSESSNAHVWIVCVSVSRWPWLSGRLYLNNVMRQGSHNHQTKQLKWEVTAKENTKQGKMFHTPVSVLWCDQCTRRKRGYLVFNTCCGCCHSQHMQEKPLNKMLLYFKECEIWDTLRLYVNMSLQLCTL